MKSKADIIENWIKALNHAYRTVKPITALSDTFCDISVEDAYLVQLQMLKERIRQEEHLIGWKIGATNPVIQKAFSFSLNEPIFGWITDKTNYSNLDTINKSSFCNLRMEAEIAIVLKTSLKGPGITYKDVTNATAGAIAAVELVGGRFKKRKTISDLIADNSGHAGIILGSIIKPIDDFNLIHEKVTIIKNKSEKISGYANEIMGDPINAVQWLANKLAQFDYELSAGSIISTGSLTKIISLEPGDKINISYTNLDNIKFEVS